jgi:hypothetical protein
MRAAMASLVARAGSPPRKDVAQGSLSSPSADGRLFDRDAGLAARLGVICIPWPVPNS